jgi:hypothetical protein
MSVALDHTILVRVDIGGAQRAVAKPSLDCIPTLKHQGRIPLEEDAIFIIKILPVVAFTRAKSKEGDHGARNAARCQLK